MVNMSFYKMSIYLCLSLESCNDLPTVLGSRFETEFHTLLLEVLHFLGSILSGSQVHTMTLYYIILYYICSLIHS